MTNAKMKVNNTYRITTTFRSFDTNAVTDCTGDVTLKIYDGGTRVQVGTTITATKSSIGIYYAHYTPTVEGFFYWVMGGTMGGLPVLDSGELRVFII